VALKKIRHKTSIILLLFVSCGPYCENESTDSNSETTNTISTLHELLIYSSLIYLIFKYYEYIIVTQLLGNTGDDGADILK
jgi:hypothetical protein